MIRLARLIPRLDSAFEHTFVHTGQNFEPELREIFFEDLGLRDPDISLPNALSGQVEPSHFGLVLESISQVAAKTRPDAAVILGDTNSGLSSIALEKMGIPVYHLEAGNRSFDPNVPEEFNRRVIDHSATFNLAYTETARRNLLREGLNPRFIGVSGSPLPEVLSYQSEKIEKTDIYDIYGVQTGGYLLFSLHRKETVSSPARLMKALKSLEYLSEDLGLPALVSLHPTLASQVRALEYKFPENFILSKPMNFSQYVRLQLDSRVVISDSGSLAEECAYLKFRALSIRRSSERPEGIEHANLALVGLEYQDWASGLRFLEERSPEVSADPNYVSPNFSDRVLGFMTSTIHSYKFWKGIQ